MKYYSSACPDIYLAYHSHHMYPVVSTFVQALRHAQISPLPSARNSRCNIFSTVTGQRLFIDQCTPEYWGRNLSSTVRFASALNEVTSLYHDLSLVEIGPHAALKNPITDSLAALANTKYAYFSSCYRSQPSFDSMLQSAGKMIGGGLPLDFATINDVDFIDTPDVNLRSCNVLTDLPPYPWGHSAVHWAETRPSREFRFRKSPRHPLLGARVHGDNPCQTIWRNSPKAEELQWIEDPVVSLEV